MAEKLPTVSADAYVIEGEVARGGLGRVLRAHHKTMGRTVAVKVLLPGVAAEARFVQEALVTGRLEHPAIVPVYEAGRWPTGEPFYTMKLVSGRSLASVIKSCASFNDRLALLPNVNAVADAIAYAHSKRVIHRDIKPANVIIGSFGETVVIDWGVAKDLEAQAGGDVIHGDVVGTPAYMAPEQAKGEAVDERADVYALGALLYHVLAGVPPYTHGAIGSDSRAPTRAVDAVDPSEDVELTKLLAEVALRPAVPLEQRQPDVPDELLTIVGKAMARDPAQRYPTAKELAEDLARFQTGKLVSAHHYTTWHLARRYLQRNRAVLAVVAAAVLALAVGGTVSIARIIEAGRVAEQRRVEADHASAVAHEARVRAEKREQELILLQARAMVDTDPTSALAWLKQYPLDGPNWAEARRIAATAAGRGVARDLFRGHKGTVRALAFSPDGTLLASAGVDGTIRLWDVARKRPTRVLRRHNGIVTDVAFSPDGKTLASAGFDRQVLLWDLANDTATPLGEHDNGVRALAWSRDGKAIATAGFNRRLIVWSVPTGEKLKVLEGHLDSPLIVDFSPDGTKLFSAAYDDTIRLWDLETGQARVFPNKSQAAYSPDGRTIAAGFDGEVRLIDVESGNTRSLRLPGLARPFAFSPDSHTLVATTIDAVRIIDTATLRVRTLSGHQSDVYDAVFAPDGRSLATSGLDGTIRIWAFPAPEGQILRGLGAGAELVAFAPDGKEVAAAGADGRIALWPLPDGAPARFLPGHAGGTKKLLYTPDGKMLVTAGGADRQVLVWDVATGQPQKLTTTSFLPRPLALGTHAPLLALADGFELLRVLSYADGKERCRVTGQNVVAAVFDEDDTQVLYGSGDMLRRLELGSCTDSAVASHGGGWVVDLALSQRWLAYATKYGKIGAVELNGRAPRSFTDDAYETRSIALSPDGRLLAVGSDLKISLWDPAAGVRLRELSGHDSPVEWVAFTGDGAHVVSRSADEVRVWRVTGDGDRVYRGHDARIKAAVVSPDGKTVASAGADGTVRLWPAVTETGLPTDPARLRAWLDDTTSVRLDDQDHISSPVPAASY